MWMQLIEVCGYQTKGNQRGEFLAAMVIVIFKTQKPLKIDVIVTNISF